MKKLIALTALCLGLGLLFDSCKKKEKETPVADESGQSSEDNRTANSENEAAVNDINDVVGNETILHGRGSGPTGANGITGTVCGLTVDTAGIKQGTIKLNYNGTTCNNRTRTGSIKLTVVDYATGKRWKQAGCVIKVEYLAYKITRASDGKFIQLDGTQLLTNLTGGSWWELLILKTQNSLATTVTGTNLKVTFSDGKTATYNINRRFTYTYPNNVITFTGEGIGSSGGLSSLENYGTTRDGEAFTSQVSTPIVWNLTCGWGAPVQGLINIKVAGKDFDLIARYSVDKDGNAVTVGANQCPYGWKLEWTVNSKTGSKVFAYN
ncbi:MAG: hypothetical protein IT236_08895 [Bacteroidia bacterium]|nr:hypothetical protein [Bacteroidia bacterium]